MNSFVTAFLAASGITFWLVVLLLAVLVVVAVVRGVKSLQAQRRAEAIGDQAEQYLRNGGAQ